MTIEEILTLFPSKSQKLTQELTNAGLHCVGCGAATWETLEAGVLGHGMSEADLRRLEERLNAVLAEEEVPADIIVLTPKAAEKYRAILAQEGKQGWGIRFTEKMAGCSGFEYILDYSEKAQPDDEIIVSQGIEIHVKKEFVSRLLGSEIDWVDGLQSAGFKVSNPNVRSSCSCGVSHGY